jgi:hypothetical protein
MPQSFFDKTLLAYWILIVPLFATICSAVKALLVYFHLESDHHSLTAATLGSIDLVFFHDIRRRIGHLVGSHDVFGTW